MAKKMLNAFFSLPQLSIRTVSQAIHRLGLIYASLPVNHRSLLIPATVALILRTLDADLYREFGSRQIAAGDVIQRLSIEPHALALHRIEQGSLFEAEILLAGDPPADPTYGEYRRIAEGEEPRDVEERSRWKHVCRVMRMVNGRSGWPEQPPAEYKAALDRLDLISDALA